MPEIKIIDGKTVKDETARNSITELQTQVNNINDAILNIKTSNITLNDCDSDMLKTLSLNDYSTITFEQGSLSGSNGQESSSTTRMRTGYLQFSQNVNINLYSEFKMRIFVYDAYKSFLEVRESTGWIYNVDSYSLEANPSYYYRIIVAYKNDAAIDINTKVFTIEGLLNTNTVEIANLKSLISGSDPKNYIARSDNYVFDFKLQSDYSADSYCSDICIVKDKLFHFGISDDDNINYVNSFVYDIDLDNKKGTYEATITHNLGHVNSVAYNDKTDALIFGNGGASFDLKGKFFVYPNFYTKYKSGTTQFNISDCIEYDCSSLEIGNEYKFNAVWGDDNFNKNNMVLLITNNHRTIHSIQLGRGTNDLGNGVLNSSAGTNEFNGTFKIQKTYTQETYGATDTDNTYCVQGAQYFGGHLYTGVGHEDVEWWDITFNRSGISRQEHVKHMCSDAGVKYTTNLGGLSVTDKYILLCVSNYVRVYLR